MKFSRWLNEFNNVKEVKLKKGWSYTEEKDDREYRYTMYDPSGNEVDETFSKTKISKKVAQEIADEMAEDM